MSGTIDARTVTTPALVYVRSNGRMSAQIWHEPKTDIDNYWRGRIVAVHPLTGSVMRTLVLAGNLRSLTQQFPPPVEKVAIAKVKI